MNSKKEIDVNGYKHILHEHNSFQNNETIIKSQNYLKRLDSRRSIRSFSNTHVPKEVIANIIKTASTSPSGANKQPWTFCAVSNSELKSKIRLAAENEERESYKTRMSTRWKKDLEPLGTNSDKPFLENAPWLIAVFKQVYEIENENKLNNYYVNESVGIACGMLISAIHNAGLASLTHTPNPMNFLEEILNRPKNERAFLLLPVGYPEQPIYVPKLDRKGLNEISEFYE